MEARLAFRASNYWKQLWHGEYFFLPGSVLGWALVGLEEMAQWVKHLLSDQEDLSSNPQSLRKVRCALSHASVITVLQGERIMA